MSRKMVVTARINGVETEFLCEPRDVLLDTLRESLGLFGCKEGCGNGNCGACTIIVDGRAVNACLMLAAEIEGSDVVTVEGLAWPGGLHPLQAAFIEYGAFQCGYCTPGFLTSAKALLDRNPHPTADEVRLELAGNLCRCTGYDKIVKAVLAAADEAAARTKGA